MVVFGLAIGLLLVMWRWIHFAFTFTRLVSRPKTYSVGYKKIKPATISHRSRRKPNGVQKGLIRLKAHMPDSGCRTLTDTFQAGNCCPGCA